MSWRLAKSLDVLRSQINAAYPGRSKADDGTIGDTSHKTRTSEHNPNDRGVVRAMDITHDPKGGCDSYALAETLRLSRDPRILYLISNGRIVSSQKKRWVWRQYNGANPHDRHMHISVAESPLLYDDTQPWAITRNPMRPLLRTRMARAIVDFEARRDHDGNLIVYNLPQNDGGGAYEVAGINVKYHPVEAASLAKFIAQGHNKEAEIQAAEIIARYTDQVAAWHADPGVEFYLRDSCFNRGPRGAARILQRAVGADDDGDIGPKSRSAIAEFTPAQVLTRLRQSREKYERDVVGFRKNLWEGLVNRWDKALAKANEFRNNSHG